MKIAKKYLVNFFIALVAIALVMGLAACGESGEQEQGSDEVTIVAEGTGYSSWGYVMDSLYQEYSDGSVVITVYFHGYGDGSMRAVYNGTVVKGTDSDGDPYVTLTVTTYSYYNGDGSKLDESTGYNSAETTYEYDPASTNTYNTSSGTYTIAFEFSLFGYNTQTHTIEVEKVGSATDVESWIAALDAADSAS